MSRCCNENALASTILGVVAGYLAGSGCDGAGLDLGKIFNGNRPGGTGENPTRPTPIPDHVVGVVWTDEGFCNLDSYSPVGAVVTVQNDAGTQNVGTNSQGHYVIPVAAGENRLTVTPASPTVSLTCGVSPVTFQHTAGDKPVMDFGFS